MRRAPFVLTLALGCASPTAPEVTDGSCTLVSRFTTSDPNVTGTLRACYRVCPEGARAFAAEHNQEFVPSWVPQCGGKAA